MLYYSKPSQPLWHKWKSRVKRFMRLGLACTSRIARLIIMLIIGTQFYVLNSWLLIFKHGCVCQNIIFEKQNKKIKTQSVDVIPKPQTLFLFFSFHLFWKLKTRQKSCVFKITISENKKIITKNIPPSLIRKKNPLQHRSSLFLSNSPYSFSL